MSDDNYIQVRELSGDFINKIRFIAKLQNRSVSAQAKHMLIMAVERVYNESLAGERKFAVLDRLNSVVESYNKNPDRRFFACAATLSERLGNTTPAPMEQVFSGQREITFEEINRICLLMFVNSDWFKTGHGGMYPFSNQTLDCLSWEKMQYYLTHPPLGLCQTLPQGDMESDWMNDWLTWVGFARSEDGRIAFVQRTNI